MATVYLADDLRHERKVALKVLKPELAAVVGADRFLAEIKTTANLQHPHILPLFDSGEASGFLFYVMPYVEGESLRERLDRERQLPVDEAVRIATDIADALQAAHDRGVIHRDIKPANILLSKGRPLVADFGIALAVSAAGGGRLTETGLSMGTPYYMSPEQASADQEARAARDVYSLGCVLYEMLAGEPPYSGGSAQAVLAKILMEDAPAPTKARASIPANVDAAIRKSLEKLPADRFAKVEDFAKALNDVGFRYGQTAQVGASAEPGFWRPLSFGLAVLALLLGGGLAWSTLSAGPAAAPPSVVRTVISAIPAAPPVLSVNGADVAITPDGSRVIYQSSLAPLELSTRALAEFGSAPLRGPAAAQWPVVSPDGEWVLFEAGDNGPLQRVPISGGPPLTIAQPEAPVWGATWAPDGRIFFGVQAPVGLLQVPAAGGQPTPLTEADGRVAHGMPDALPNGAGVLFSTNLNATSTAEDQIAVLDLRTGEYRILIESGSSPRYVASGHILYVLNGTLMAASFDAERLELTSDPIPMIDDVLLKPIGSASYAVSETGSLVYITGGATSGNLREVVWVDRDGTEELLPLPRRPYTNPRVSPDGSRLAIGVADDTGSTMLWVYDVASAAGQRLTQEGTAQVPVWTNDDRIFFANVTPGSGVLQIFSVPADGSGEPRQVLNSEGILGDYPTSVTPDGSSLIFSRVYTLPHREIYQMSLDGEPVATGVLEGEFNRGNAEVSPDGRWMVYRSDQSGQMEIFVQPFPGPGPTVPVSIGGGTSVTWSADGTELIYRLDDRMMAVPFNVQEGRPVVGQPIELFRGPYVEAVVGGPREYHVAPDGRFLMLKNVGGDQGVPLPPRVVLVQNFFEELRARLPN